MDRNKKIALVTGASSGLGEALSRVLIQQGWRVFGVARTVEKLGELGTQLGPSFHPMPCDVSQPAAVSAACQTLIQGGYSPTLVILNAGGGDLDHDEGVDLHQHRSTFDSNYFGAIQWIQELLKAPPGEGEGVTFVAIASVLSHFATPHAAAYCASKAALKSTFDSLRLKYMGTPNMTTPMRFVSVFPGPMQTCMLKSSKPVPFTQCPAQTAAYVLEKVFLGKNRIYPSLLYRTFFWIISFFPDKVAAKILGSSQET